MPTAPRQRIALFITPVLVSSSEKRINNAVNTTPRPCRTWFRGGGLEARAVRRIPGTTHVEIGAHAL